jgi:ABC-type transport system substrate-binding protein
MKTVSSNNENNQSAGFFGGNYLSTGNEFFQGELPWNDVRVREALNRAIDREAILDAVYQGQATKMPVYLYAPFTEGWSDRWVQEFDEKYGYDPERAIELLAEAGYGPGDIEIDIASTVIPGNPEIPLLSETIATMWEEIGVSTSIQDLEIGTWLDKWSTHNLHNTFSIIRNTPIRTTQEGLRTFYASQPDGFLYGFEHDFINEKFACLRDSVDADERDGCARDAGNFIFDEYTSLPLFQITFDMIIDPEFISSWQYPGVGSAHPTHVQNIRACPVGTDRCD